MLLFDVLCISHMQQSLIEMYTDVLNLLTGFDAKSSRKDGKFINTLPQVLYVYVVHRPDLAKSTMILSIDVNHFIGVYITNCGM